MTVLAQESPPQPKPEARTARPGGPNRRNNARRRMVDDKPDGPRIRFRGLDVVSDKRPSSGEQSGPKRSEAPKPETAPTAGAVDSVDQPEIAAAEAGISDEVAAVGAALEAVTETEEALSEKATNYAADRVVEKDAGVPVNEQFRVVGAMKKSAVYKEELGRLIQAEGGKPNRQRLQELQEQAARSCYYREAQRQIATEDGAKIIEGLKGNAVFEKALKRETDRALARLKTGESTDPDDIDARDLAEVLSSEAIKKDKSLIAMILKGLAMFGIGMTISLGNEGQTALKPAG